MHFDAIIGVSVRATSSENSTAMVAVKAKGLKNSPGMPSMNATGMNTAHSVSVVATTARPISMAASVAACSGGLPMRRWRTMFSTSTMASSTSMPTTSDSASMVSVFIEKPNSVQRPEGRDDRQRQRRGGDQRGADVAQEQPDHDDGQDRALDQHHHRVVEDCADATSTVVVDLGDLDVRVFLLQLPRRPRACRRPPPTAPSPQARITWKPITGLPSSSATWRTSAAWSRTSAIESSRMLRPSPSEMGSCGQFLHDADGAQRAHALFLRADAGFAAGQLHLGAHQLARDVAGGDAQRRHAVRVQVDAHFARHAADAADLPDAGHGADLAHHVQVDEPGQFGVAEVLRS